MLVTGGITITSPNTYNGFTVVIRTPHGVDILKYFISISNFVSMSSFLRQWAELSNKITLISKYHIVLMMSY